MPNNEKILKFENALVHRVPMLSTIITDFRGRKINFGFSNKKSDVNLYYRGMKLHLKHGAMRRRNDQNPIFDKNKMARSYTL